MESESTADKYSHVFRFVNWRNENNQDFVRVQQIFACILFAIPAILVILFIRIYSFIITNLKDFYI